MGKDSQLERMTWLELISTIILKQDKIITILIHWTRIDQQTGRQNLTNYLEFIDVLKKTFQSYDGLFKNHCHYQKIYLSYAQTRAMLLEESTSKMFSNKKWSEECNYYLYKMKQESYVHILNEFRARPTKEENKDNMVIVMKKTMHEIIQEILNIIFILWEYL